MPELFLFHFSTTVASRPKSPEVLKSLEHYQLQRSVASARHGKRWRAQDQRDGAVVAYLLIYLGITLVIFIGTATLPSGYPDVDDDDLQELGGISFLQAAGGGFEREYCSKVKEINLVQGMKAI
ncbi:hypothetical protein U1Q18_012747 [Sarracenia purpurea var. burkii]